MARRAPLVPGPGCGAMSRRHHLRLLWAAATDETWRRVEHRGRVVLQGKCIHCNRKLTLSPDGTPGPSATLEHIVPRTHGGTNALDNLAVACRGCNGQKGVRLDVRAFDDPTLQAVIDTLRGRRATRWRAAPVDWGLPPWREDAAGEGSEGEEEAPRRPRRGRRGRRRKRSGRGGG